MNDDTTLDLLLGRILDRRAAPADWDAFATLAQARPDTWGALLSALRSEQGLLIESERELAVVDGIELPEAGAVPVPAMSPAMSPAIAPTMAPSMAPVMSLAAARAPRAWVGWAAAAVLACAWAGSALSVERASVPGMPGTSGVSGDLVAQGASPALPALPALPAVTAPDGSASATQDVAGDASPGPGGTHTQGQGALADAATADPPAVTGDTPVAPQPFATGGDAAVPLVASADDGSGPRLRDPADVDSTYGDIVGELPLQLVSSIAAPDGNGLDVLYVRPVLERARVSGMYSLGLDDAGRPAPVSLHAGSLLKAGSN